jgi:transposase
MTGTETITISKAEYLSLKNEIAYQKQQLADLKRMIFGAKSERYIAADPNQPTLFELPEEEKETEKPKQQIEYTRTKPENKKQPVRFELPGHLPRVTEVIEPEGLPANAKRLNCIITEILEYEAGKLYVRQIMRYNYILSQTDEKTDIVIAPLPSLPIPKGNAGASLIAYIITSKFVDHLPFYRQIQMFKRQGIIFPESTYNGWSNKGIALVEPVCDKIKQIALSGSYLMADETPIPVLTSDKPGATHKGYLWAYYDPINKLVFFDYRKSRERAGPNEVLSDYEGYLQTDGYTAYNDLKNKHNIIQLACMAHARRKFEHALENDHALADHALKLIGSLYDIERHATEAQLTFDQIKELRLEKSLPILEEFKSWMDEKIIQVKPKSAIGLAIAYTLKLWSRLIRYTEDGRLKIDNNLIENSIRPIALGRKNYLFAGSHESAQQIAVVYSLLGTCKIRGIEPQGWLKKVLTVIPDWPANQVHKLIPGEL